MAFKVAGSMAFRNAALIADPVLLEPMMKVEVVTPEDYMGDVMGDLTRRRGMLQGMEDSPAGKMVNAHVPLVGDVRLCDRPEVPDPGPRDLHHGIRSLRRSAGQCVRRRLSRKPPDYKGDLA